jgi:hypothetical protein
MAIYPNCQFGRCRFYRLVQSNKLWLRWLTLPPVALLPFIIILADMLTPWHITYELIGFYSVCVLGGLALAYGIKRNGK